MANTARNLDKSSWHVRRRFMFIVTAFCMGVVLYPLLSQLDTRVADTAVTMAFLTIIAITGSYVFGAVWEDISVFKGGASRTTITAERVEPAPPQPGPGQEPEADK